MKIEKKYREELHTNNQKRIELEKPNLVIEKEDELIFQASHGWESILGNFIGGIEWALKYKKNFDVIIRTNVSSYWHIDSTIELINSLPNSGVYAGNVVRALNCNFVAGDGIILSRDVALKILENSHKLDANVIDDVAIGRFCQDQNIQMTHIPRRWVRTRFDINHPDLVLGNTHLFRCKFERRLLGRYLRRDISLMKALHARFRSN